VVDPAQKLVGVCSLRQLLLAAPEASLGNIMTERVVAVGPETDQERVAEIAERYRLLAVPVIDDNGVLLGIITVDDLLQVYEHTATEEMLEFAGTRGEEVLTHSVFRIFRIRLPWLAAAFMGGLAAGGIINLFEATLSQVLALGVFLPIVIGMAGNVGTVAATVSVRGLATGSLKLSDFGSLLFKEMRVGLMLGGFYGAILGVAAWWIFSDVALGETVGLTILANMTMAALIAAVLPMLFHRMGADPAVATGPFVTTAVDILGVSNYFILATLILNVGG
jgi:magnesium transporter